MDAAAIYRGAFGIMINQDQSSIIGSEQCKHSRSSACSWLSPSITTTSELADGVSFGPSGKPLMNTCAVTVPFLFFARPLALESELILKFFGRPRFLGVFAAFLVSFTATSSVASQAELTQTPRTRFILLHGFFRDAIDMQPLPALGIGALQYDLVRIDGLCIHANQVQLL